MEKIFSITDPNGSAFELLDDGLEEAIAINGEKFILSELSVKIIIAVLLGVDDPKMR